MISILGIIGIFVLSKVVLRHAFLFFHRFTHSRHLIISVISLLYFPGTTIHEISHYIIALILNMSPEDVSLFPHIEGNKIRLGHVTYRRDSGDFIRPLLVGIAPIFGAMAVLWLLMRVNALYGYGIWGTIATGYFILSVTANMFSSEQDLRYMWYIIPVIVLLGMIYYVVPVKIQPEAVHILLSAIGMFFTTIQPAVLFSLFGHAILLLLFIIINKRII